MSKELRLQEPAGEAGFIDQSELLRRLPISRRTVYNLERAGKLPCCKIGRRKLYHWKSVEVALLRQQRGVTFEISLEPAQA